MALQQKLDIDDIALLEVVEDPIWLGEFLRTTNDGEVDKKLWPALKWKYRDYQRQFLSDESEFILYTGGRAIGKCSPTHARIYTVDGYKKISELIKERAFVVYALTPDMTLEQRRAVCVFDRRSTVWTITTAAGHTFHATENHPILTPDGYKLVAHLTEEDYVAVATRLPFESNKSAFNWSELRILGYSSLSSNPKPEIPIIPRFNAIGKEIEYIADNLLVNWHKSIETGAYTLHRKGGKFKHPITSLFEELQLLQTILRFNKWKRIPWMIKTEKLENIQVFLEAMFAQHATLSAFEVSVKVPTIIFAEDLQELLLRFGIETSITANKVTLLDDRAIYRFWSQFHLPGVTVSKLKIPPASNDPTDFMRFDRIVSKKLTGNNTDTYAIHVYKDNNYISDNLFVHNSVVLEDKIVHEVVNSDIEFPVTQESVLVTPNQAQMTPLLGKIALRFTSSKFLRDFLKGQINRSDGTMKFPIRTKPMIFNFRIAGSRGENNMVGLHVPRIRGDEMQLFPINAFTQLQPAYNQWEPKRQQIHAGVPNGLRNSVLYMLDMQTPKYKKYRIPSHANPYYTYEDDIDNIRKYGGEQDDRYQQLVLGRHGAAAFQVIPRESITTETYTFSNQRYNSGHVNKGINYDDILQRPTLPDGLQAIVVAIDPGFVDPTIIQVIGRDKRGIWRTYVRYRLTRIDFNQQQKIIDWVSHYYDAGLIAIDIGAGGNGAAMMHNLIHGEEYKKRKYEHRMIGVQFSEQLIAGYDEDGEELKQDTKGYAANELAKLIQEGRLVFSEFDNEGLSQLERVAKQKSTAGRDKYFVLNDRGAGPDEDDHIFASYICFIVGIKDSVINPHQRKLGQPRGADTYHQT